MEAHGRNLFCPGRKSVPTDKSDGNKSVTEGDTQIRCYRCGSRGHRTVNCQAQTANRCYSCGKQGQEARNCRSNSPKSAPQSNACRPGHKRQLSAGCLVQTPSLQASPEEIQSCIENDHLLLACGKKVPLLRDACVQPLSGARSKIPVFKGRVAGKTVNILRDTGCSGIVVKTNLVTEEKYKGYFSFMPLVAKTVKKVPIARFTVDTPYLSGEVEAQCLPDAIYDLIIGNVPGVIPTDETDPSCQEACAEPKQTRRESLHH